MIANLNKVQPYQLPKVPSYPPRPEETGTSRSTARKVGEAVSIQNLDSIVVVGSAHFTDMMMAEEAEDASVATTSSQRHRAISAYTSAYDL